MNTTAKLLSFDPLYAAEQMTGQYYQDDEGTSALGFLLAMAHSQEKNTHLTEQDDTTLSNDLNRYIRIITEMGFEQVLQLPFAGKLFGDEDYRHEHYFIFAHRQHGLLLAFDTFGGDQVNGGKLYYCWRPKDITQYVPYLLSSGHYCNYDSPDRYWAGDHDCREAIRYNVANLLQHGTFLSKWPSDNGQFLWLLHYMDTRQEGYDYASITVERIAMLPQWVQEMIGR